MIKTDWKLAAAGALTVLAAIAATGAYVITADTQSKRVAAQPAPAIVPTALAVGTRETWADPAYSARAFTNMQELFATRRIAAGDVVTALHSAAANPPLSYEYKGKVYDLDAFAARNRALGLIVVHGQRILFENYYQGADRNSRFMSFSSGKPFISALVGFALAQGAIGSLDDRVDRYLSDLKGTAYEEATIRDLLQMSSGTSFDEDSEDFTALLAVANRQAGGFYDFAKSFRSAYPPGSKFNYASTDTEVLGALLSAAVKTTLSDYLSEKLWKPLGAEADALWMLDAPGQAGRELAAGGLQIRLRDYARFGLLFAQDGMVGERRVLPDGWARLATTVQRPGLAQGKLGIDNPYGYGYQWWLLPDSDSAFAGMGLYGQFLMVDPDLDLVIVKMGNWDQDWDPDSEQETLAMFQSIRTKLRR